MADMERSELLDQAQKLASAAMEGDGLSAAKILQEAGSCGWKNLIQTANSEYLGDLRLITSGAASAQFEDIDLYLVNDDANYYGELRDNRVLPLAKVGDLRCNEK